MNIEINTNFRFVKNFVTIEFSLLSNINLINHGSSKIYIRKQQHINGYKH